MASEGITQDAADPVSSAGTDSDRSVRDVSRLRVRRRFARGVLVVGALLTVMGASMILACFINDRTIEEARGQSVAEVVDTSPIRTAVRFNTEDGRVFLPPNGVLYPSDLQVGQLVRVEYDARNPDLVRVAGRNWTVSLLPVASSLAVVWAVLLPAYYLLRRSIQA